MTAQAYDRLHHRGRALALAGEPLAGWLAAMPRERRPNFVVTGTDCWRGYVATWELRDGLLHLAAITGTIAPGLAPEPGQPRPRWIAGRAAGLADLFPGATGPVPATFITATLRCPEGSILDYVHLGHASLFARDRVFQVEAGRVRGEYLRENADPPVWSRVEPDGTLVELDAPPPLDPGGPKAARPGRWARLARYFGSFASIRAAKAAKSR